MNPFSEFEQFLLSAGMTERDLKEIAFARLYNEDFKHGTDGHNRLIIIARLASMVDALTDANGVRGYIGTMQWSGDATEMEKTLVAGNINAFSAWQRELFAAARTR